MKKFMQKNFDPFKNLVLDAEEQAIEDAFERGEYTSVENLAETKAMFKQAAINYTRKHKTKRKTKLSI